MSGAIIRPELARVIKMLIAVARTAHVAMDDAQEYADGVVIEPSESNELSKALDALETLPDDRPGYTMSGPARAEWALRDMIGDPKP